jgi:hypothetical protein
VRADACKKSTRVFCVSIVTGVAALPIAYVAAHVVVVELIAV